MSQMLKRVVPRAAHGTALLGSVTGEIPIRAIAALGLGPGPLLRSADGHGGVGHEGFHGITTHSPHQAYSSR
jgi:hypothetical protein